MVLKCRIDVCTTTSSVKLPGNHDIWVSEVVKNLLSVAKVEKDTVRAVCSYVVRVKESCTYPDLLRLRRTLTHMVHGQIAPYGSSNAYGVEVTNDNLFAMALTITLPTDHDRWIPDAIKSLESVMEIRMDVMAAAMMNVDDRMSDLIGSNSITKTNFLALPAELRDIIYRLYLADEPSISDKLRVPKIASRIPNLLLASTQIYIEARPVAYELRLRTIADSVMSKDAPVQPEDADNEMGEEDCFQTFGGIREVKKALLDLPPLATRRSCLRP